MKHMINLNLESTRKVREDDDVFLIEDFIEQCKGGSFIDYDGYADELVIDGKVVFSFYDELGRNLFPSDLLQNESRFLEMVAQYPGLGLVWYNN